MTARVIVIGDLMVDVVVVPAGPIHHGSDTPADVRALGGGSAANTACWLAATGLAVELVAAVGDDAFGATAIAGVAAAGVSFGGPTLAGCATGACVVLVDADGERTMLPDRGANDLLPVESVTASLVARAAWVHLSGYTLLGDGSRPAGLAGLEAVRAAGGRWSVDASSAAPLEAVGADAFLGWITGASVLFANGEELAVLGGVDRCLESVDAVVVKHGERGASWHEAGRSCDVAAVPTDVVDTVGAGDAFDAGVLSVLVPGGVPGAALEAGAALAARAVSQRGARPGSPRHR